MKIVRQFRPDLRAWLIGLLLGCGTSSGISAVSNPASTVEPVTWRGATIVGYEPAAGVPYVEAGWQGALRKYGPGREPVGWRVDLFPGPVPCPGVTPTGECGGTTIVDQQRIQATWSRGEAQLVAILEHEFCHYLRYTQTGKPLGPGCEA